MELYAILAGAVFLAALTQGIAGFGAGMVAMAILPFVLEDLEDAVAVVAILCLVINGAIFIQLRQHVQRAQVLPMILGAVIGVPLGSLALQTIPAQYLKLGLGLVILWYSGQSLLSSGSQRRLASDRWGFPFGLAGGALGGAFNTGGPPAVIYVTLKDWNKDQVKATLQAFFLSISLTQLPVYLAAGILRTEHLLLDAVALPALGLGLWVGTRVYDRIDTEAFRKVVLVGLGIIGLIYVGGNLQAPEAAAPEPSESSDELKPGHSPDPSRAP